MTMFSSHNLDGSSDESRTPRLFKIAAVLCGLVLTLLLFAVVWHLYTVYFGEPPPELEPDLMSVEESLTLHRTGAYILARHIQEKYEDPLSVLIIGPPDDPAIDGRMETETLKALKTALADVVSRIEVERPEVDPNALPVANLWFRAEAFDAIVERHPQIDLIVSTIGLPLHPEAIQFWKKPSHPDFMVMNSQIFRIAELIAGGGIQAVMTRRPARTTPVTPLPADSPEHWLLITSENIEEIRERHQNLFVEQNEKEDDKAE